MVKKNNLPPRLRKKQRHRAIHYYYDARATLGKEIPLGKDYALALKQWAELEGDKPSNKIPQLITFRYVAEQYMLIVLPTKSPQTQLDNIKELRQLYLFFDNPPAPIEKIKPMHIKQYLTWRTAKVRANREKALFSHIWNFAREKGYTDLPNPCAGIKGNKEIGRKDIYIEDNLYDAVYRAADQPLRDAMDMAYLTGQRPSDVLRMSEADIVNGTIRVTQAKTRKKLRISIEGDLDVLIKRIFARKSQHVVRALHLIVDKTGQRYTYAMLRYHFDKARKLAGIAKEEFQFRDLRGKAGTDTAESSDIYQAQRQLGHAHVTMTQHYIRERKGDVVKPTRKK